MAKDASFFGGFRRGLGVALFAVLPGAIPPAAAQGPELVRDIATGPAFAGGFFVGLPVPLRGRNYFAADDGFLGNELWSTDGTPGGTRLVADLCPGRCAGNPAYLTVAGVSLFFIAGNETGTADALWLWRSDGTAEGTYALKNLEIGFSGSSFPLSFFSPFGRGVVFLVHERERDGWGLWFSDGSRAGTRQIAPLPGRFNPANLPGDFNWPRATDEPGTHYFTWRLRLWATDGTAAGTRPVETPIVPCGGSWARLGRQVIYAGEVGRENCEPWVSDDTRQGTRRLRDVVAGDATSFPGEFVAVGNRVYFTAFDEAGRRILWKTDGTTRGTVPVRAAGGGRGLGKAQILATVGSRLYFTASDGAHGRELWRTDGTPESTSLVADLSPGRADTQFATGVGRGRQVFFVASPQGGETGGLFVTEGTEESTVRLADAGDSAVALSGGRVYFVGHLGESARGLGVTDGTADRTRILLRARPVRSSDPRQMTATPGGLLFTADAAAVGPEIWRSGGTAESTEPLPGIAPTTFPSTRLFPGLGGAFLYRFSDQSFSWTDGLSAREVLPPDSIGIPVGFSTERNGRSVFLAPRPTSEDGEEVWVWSSDGTPEGTAPVVRAANQRAPFSSFWNWAATPEGGDLRYLVQQFVGNFPDSLSNLGETDGTAEGTRSLVRFPVPKSFQVRAFVAAGRNVFALFEQQGGRAALWASDGTTEGTREVLAGPGDDRIGLIDSLVAAGDQVFLSVYTATSGLELWASDGTPEGTRQVLDVASGFASSYPSDFAAFGSRLLFSADDGEHGRELWITDGSAQGTHRLEIRPGPQGSYPQAFFSLGDRAVFAADDGVHGLEIWTTDGTPEGTRLAAEVIPGPLGGSPRGVAEFGDELLFNAGRPREGYELWKLPLSETVR